MTDVIGEELKKRKRIAKLIVGRDDVQKLAGLEWEAYVQKMKNIPTPYKMDQVILVDVFEYLNPLPIEK